MQAEASVKRSVEFTGTLIGWKMEDKHECLSHGQP